MDADYRMTFTFENNEAAEKAKAIAAEVIMKTVQSHYFSNAAEELVSKMMVLNNAVVVPEGCGSLLAEETMETVSVIVKAIANNMPGCPFKYESVGEDEYQEAWNDGSFDGKTLEINTTFYPAGYTKYVSCPECGEYVVRIEDYVPGKLYVCPDCGEEVDLSESYEEVAPIVEKTTVTF